MGDPPFGPWGSAGLRRTYSPLDHARRPDLVSGTVRRFAEVCRVAAERYKLRLLTDSNLAGGLSSGD